MSPEVARAVWLARQHYFTLYLRNLEHYLPANATPQDYAQITKQVLCAVAEQIKKDNPDQPEAAPAPPVLPRPPPKPDNTTQALGYSGQACQCGSFRTRRNGTCLICDDCFQTTGCS